jgi:hypothetical protein
MMKMNMSANVRSVVLRDAQGNAAGTVTASKTTKKNRKCLSYNYKKVSSQILRAETSGSAEQAVTQARAQAAQLRKKRSTGEYDDKELESAIIHAERVVWIAKKKEKNLKEEERVKLEGAAGMEAHDDEDDSIRERYLKEPEVKSRQEYRKMVEKLQKILDKLNDSLAEEMLADKEETNEEFGVDAREEIDPVYLAMMKKKHRSDEFREVTEADLNYLKSRFAS